MDDPTLPKLVFEKNIRLFLGLVRVKYYAEDRRPDLANYDGKFKHYLIIRVLWKRLTWTFRSPHLYALLPGGNY